jgi:hypothetical protein
MDKREQKLIEYGIEAIVIAWLAYITFYQNYLLYKWHRGLPLPSRLPFFLLGLATGLAFFWYEWDSLEKRLSTPTPEENIPENEVDEGKEPNKENEEENIRAPGSESPLEP